MLTDKSVEFIYGEGKPGTAVAFVIGDDLVYDIPAWKEFYDLLIFSDDIIDLSDDYPDHDGITVGFIKDGIQLEVFQTTEYFGSILLSNPTILDMAEYENGSNVLTPAKFINNVFIQV